MIQITDKQKCCGCEACAQACPKAYKSLKLSFEQQLKRLVKYPLLLAKKTIKALLHKGEMNPTGGTSFVIVVSYYNQNTKQAA